LRAGVGQPLTEASIERSHASVDRGRRRALRSSACPVPVSHKSSVVRPSMSTCNPPQRSNRQRHSRAHRAQGIGCSPQRNKGGGRRPGDIRGGEYPVPCARAPNNGATKSKSKKNQRSASTRSSTIRSGPNFSTPWVSSASTACAMPWLEDDCSAMSL